MMLHDVPKPFVERTDAGDEAKRKLIASEDVPKPDVFGEPGAQLAEAAAMAERAGKEIAPTCRGLPPRQLRSVLTAFKRQIIPPGKPGRKKTKRITAAYNDWKTGIRGLALFRKHIPRFSRMNIWQRKVKSRALMDAIRTRKRREEKCETALRCN